VYQLALDALDHHADIEAVYSIGGGNRAILDAFDARQRPCRAFIAHDLSGYAPVATGRAGSAIQLDQEPT
jgi:hypothetical protein